MQKSKITGEEERYSHIDILDFAANVEGSQQAFAALKPALDKIDPTLSPPITKQFDALQKQLDALRDPNSLGDVKLYTQLSKAQIKQLADALLAVQAAVADLGEGRRGVTEGPRGSSGPPPAGAAPSRRRFLGGAALTAAGLVVGGGVGYGIRAATEPAADESQGTGGAGPSSATGAPAGTSPGTSATRTVEPLSVAEQESVVVPFYGARQAGITTTQQDRLMFAALDVTSTDVQDLELLLGRWAAMAARFSEGKPVSSAPEVQAAPPIDTGEAMDLGPHALTITVGFGAGLFDDRFGLSGKLPAALRPMGPIPGEADMKADLTGGDLCIQACADDPQVVFHAVRNMIRVARGTAVLRWSQLGFGRASATGAAQATPRNLMGFKDGTRNIRADDVATLDEHVWVADETDQPWMRGGTYLVARKIGMRIESWDADVLSDQERIFGRVKDTGAPLSGGTEFTPIDFTKTAADGRPVIDMASHVRLASPEQNSGVRILRRGYNYTDGQDPVTGTLDAGLFFIAFQKDPHNQFKVLQSRLGQRDLLAEYISTIGGGVWACPPGVSAAGDWFGRGLFT